MLFCFIEICHKIHKGSVNMSLGVNSVNLGASKGVTFGNGEEKLSQQSMNEGEKKGLLTTTKVVTGLAALALLGTAVYYGMRGKAGEEAAEAAGKAAEKAGEVAGKAGEDVADAAGKVAGEAAGKAGEVASKAGEEAAEAAGKAAEKAGEAAGKAGEDVADAAGKAAKTGESAAETGKGTENADEVGKPASKGKANPLSLLHRKSTVAASIFNADDAKSIERINKTYDEVVAGLKENLDLSAEEVKKLDTCVDNASSKIKDKLNCKFEPGSENAKIVQELRDYYTKHNLMTPEIFAKFAFLEQVSRDSITKENLLKILQKW